ncbi:hypothetical protein MSG28_014442 [Choristoneura fumiferana]|uniref:Uncharacterized protein n=1 Tax=Choristoneura fumiferana TaxID=7141 RepID=A0ACC0JS36_CHOFU|nr:hypothetical protein MSG28_014442 [Choristoneura fumiferana]
MHTQTHQGEGGDEDDYEDEYEYGNEGVYRSLHAARAPVHPYSIKNFHCTECAASFYRKTDLDRHIKIHTGDRPHECDICSKTFVQKINFVMHMKTHSGEKPHECQVCLKRFLTRSKLMLHSKRHEKKKGKEGC